LPKRAARSDDLTGCVTKRDVRRDVVLGVALDLPGDALLVAKHLVAQRQRLFELGRRSHDRHRIPA
jgi:hypothetical protein